MGRKVKIEVTESRCRAGFHRKNQEYIIDEDRTVCPEMCMELWHYAYPYVWNLLNGGTSDSAERIKKRECDVVCPDEQRVHLHIEVINE